MTVTIRKVRKSDIENLLPLYEDLGYPSTKEELETRLAQLLSQPHYGMLVAEEDNQLLGFIGYAKLYFFEASGFYYRILALAVSQNARRRGIATALMDEVREIALKDGAKALALNSGLTAARSVAYQFYEKYGFEKLTTGFGLPL